MSSLLNQCNDLKTDYIELAILDESADYEVDITEIHYDPKTKEFLLLTASGCSCWGGEFSEERFKSLKELGESILKEDRQYNPTFNGAKQLLIEAEEAFKEYKMQVITSEKLPIKIWTDNIDDNALEQAKNLANLPFAKKWIAVMADTHLGYGMPIGGVIATERVIIPNAVGVDIGCGMKARKTNLTEIDKETLKKILNQIQRDIPTGFNHQKEGQPISEKLSLLISSFVDTDFNVPDEMKKTFEKMPLQMGTLGGGNHFIEIQKGDDGHIWIMLHSGSRGIGKLTCDYYNRIAEDLNTKWYTNIQKDLAFLPFDCEEGQEYYHAMKIGMQFAEDNRLHMLERVTNAMLRFIPDMKVEEAIDTHHNYAAMENHYKENYLVHRKGAVRATGKVIIPGSMGTYSYIGEGLQNPESFWSCSHGAGRVMGRKEATRQFTAQKVLEEMKQKDIELYKVKKDDVAEECAAAYKDIDVVMENQKDLVKPLVKLKPLGVVKG